MDLSVSPDLPAYICYGIVLVLGVLVAVAQVKKRLGGMEGKWFVSGTWLLFAAYTAVPVFLFWLLDRTGAITDTSLFAAVLIAVGYERIITGSNQAVRAPGDVSAFWTPFVNYADKVSKAVLERGAQNQLRLAEKLIGEIMKDPERYASLEALALARSSDTAAARAVLAEIDGAQGSGEADKREKKTRYLYGLLLSVPDIHYLLKEKKVISRQFYFEEVRRLPRRIAIAAIVVAVYLGFEALARAYPIDYREMAARYNVWRLGKINTTSFDQYRSRRNLVSLMRAKAPIAKEATDRLLYLVQRPGLPMERVDLVLQTLLESRFASVNDDLSSSLVQGLRAGSLDARARVNDVLVFLAASCPTQMDATLKDWKPTERDSSTMLEDKVNGWNRFWAETCRSKPAS